MLHANVIHGSSFLWPDLGAQRVPDREQDGWLRVRFGHVLSVFQTRAAGWPHGSRQEARIYGHSATRSFR